MSSSRGNRGDKGKGIAHDDDAHQIRSKSKRPSRREQAEYLSEQFARRLQEQEDYAAAVELGNSADDDVAEIEGLNFNTSPTEDEVQQSSRASRQQMPPPAPTVTEAERGHTHTSDIFLKHFRKVEIEDPSNPNEKKKKYHVYCNYCTMVYKFTHGGGYGTFRRHLEAKHPTEYGIDNAQTQLNYQSHGASGAGVTGSSQPGTLPLFKYDHSNATDIMAKYCSMRHQPFNHCDDEIFEYGMKNAYNPAAKRISRTNLVRRIRKQAFEKKLQLAKYLMRLDHKISICSDVWTDAYFKNNYMGITCHFIDNSYDGTRSNPTTKTKE